MTGKKQRITPYFVITAILLVLLAIFFLFPLYWIVTGSVKEKSDIIIKAGESVKWIPTTISWDNFARLFKSQTTLFGIDMPMAIRWLFNSVFISIVAMILTCFSASLAGYALAKKRFWGRGFIFSLFVCAMAAGDVHPPPGGHHLGLHLRGGLPCGGLALRRVPHEAVLRGHPLLLAGSRPH